MMNIYLQNIGLKGHKSISLPWAPTRFSPVLCSQQLINGLSVQRLAYEYNMSSKDL
jgi:hypothetical protein